jgi:hypothetical protein
MADEDGNVGFPLVDLVSNDPPADISTGEEQLLDLAGEIADALQAMTASPREAEAECHCKDAYGNSPRADCPYCDGTGDVHRIDGEWLGECTECSPPSPPTLMPPGSKP